MFLKYIIPLLLVASLIGAGVFIGKQQSAIADLNDRIEIIQTSRETEQRHFKRELERIGDLEDLKDRIGVLNAEADKDTSDADGMFSPTRLQRLNQVR